MTVRLVTCTELAEDKEVTAQPELRDHYWSLEESTTPASEFVLHDSQALRRRSTPKQRWDSIKYSVRMFDAVLRHLPWTLSTTSSVKGFRTRYYFRVFSISQIFMDSTYRCWPDDDGSRIRECHQHGRRL